MTRKMYRGQRDEALRELVDETLEPALDHLLATDKLLEAEGLRALAMQSSISEPLVCFLLDLQWTRGSNGADAESLDGTIRYEIKYAKRDFVSVNLKALEHLDWLIWAEAPRRYPDYIAQFRCTDVIEVLRRKGGPADRLRFSDLESVIGSAHTTIWKVQRAHPLSESRLEVTSSSSYLNWRNRGPAVSRSHDAEASRRPSPPSAPVSAGSPTSRGPVSMSPQPADATPQSIFEYWQRRGRNVIEVPPVVRTEQALDRWLDSKASENKSAVARGVYRWMVTRGFGLEETLAMLAGRSDRSANRYAILGRK